MKKFLIGMTIALHSIVPVSAAQLSPQECAALREYVLLTGELIEASHEVNRAGTFGLMELSLQNTTYPNTQQILSNHRNATEKLAPIYDRLTESVDGLMPLINSCQ